MSDHTQIPAASARGVRDFYRERFGREPEVVASAPGRVNLIGEHTDYNGGEVLPIAIGRRTWVAVGARARNAAPVLRAASFTESGVGEVPMTRAAKSGAWWDYVLGVAAPLVAAGSERATGSPSLDVAVTSDVPAGSGLSSSAALEVATAFAVSHLLRVPLDAREAALASWRAETEFVGVASGIMDQFASALGAEGQALHIDCATTATRLAPFGDTVLIFDTAVRRALRDSAFNQRRAECGEALRLLQQRWPALSSLAMAEPEQVLEAGLPDPLGRRALHVSRETRRVREAVRLLEAGTPITRELLVGSHESLRDLYECSRPELDWVVERAVNHPGVRGARLTGAGWGGCAIVTGDAGALAEAAPRLAGEYQGRFGLTPRLWVSGASAGARIEPGS